MIAALGAVLRAGAALVLATLAACATQAPAPAVPAAAQPTVPAAATAGAAIEFEHGMHDRAEAQTRRGQLADAATAWEILTVLRPGSADYRARLDDVRQRIAAALPDHLQRAQQAFKRGDLDSAAAHDLAVLALAPGNTQAADGLRAVERQRNKRVYLGKPSHLTLTRGVIEDAQMMAASRNDFEDATTLRTQGEVDAAVALLERHLQADRHDVAVCEMLADMYFQQGEKLIDKDNAAAATWYQKSLRLDGSNTAATARLARIGKGIPGGSTRPGGSAPATCNAVR